MPKPRKLQVTAYQRFGKLKVLDPETIIPSQQSSRPHGWRAALCLCDCGKQKAVRLNHLLSGAVQSCGCSQGNLKHGLARRGAQHPLYMTWALMMDRCHNPASKDYPKWGGRGISVCPEWHDVTAFVTWIEVNLGPRPEGTTPGGRPMYTLDRAGNSGNYAPGNVRWATGFQQTMNSGNRSSPDRRAVQLDLIRATRLLRQGELSQQTIADTLGISQTTVSKYLRDMPAEQVQRAWSLRANGKSLAEIAKIMRISRVSVRYCLAYIAPAPVEPPS